MGFLDLSNLTGARMDIDYGSWLDAGWLTGANEGAVIAQDCMHNVSRSENAVRYPYVAYDSQSHMLKSH